MTDLRGERRGEAWKGLAEEHKCISAWTMATDNSVAKAERGEQGLAGRGQRGKW